MRNVSIFSGSELIGNQFHQLNDVKLQSAPILKSYTMADGSPCIYTAVNAKHTTEIVLECSQADARKLSQCASSAELTFTGINIVGNADFTTSIVCYLMGAVQIELVSENADICRVRLPVQVVNGI